MIALNLEDIRFILTTFTLPENYREFLDKLASEDEKSISDEVADALRELCTDRLDTHGFDGDYNPNEEGRKLEELVDKLYTG